jgi:hypothetical protein
MSPSKIARNTTKISKFYNPSANKESGNKKIEIISNTTGRVVVVVVKFADTVTINTRSIGVVANVVNSTTSVQWHLLS